MLFSLRQIIEGLQNGRAFQRPLNDGGMEYCTPVGDGQFRHDVAGRANGGWGGSAILPIEILENGRWGDKWEGSRPKD